MSFVADISSVDTLDFDPVGVVIATPEQVQPLAAYYVNNLAVAELQSLLGVAYVRPISNANHHVIVDIDCCDSCIELEDGSHWEISWNRQGDVFNWNPGDEVEIQPNNLFSPYKYRLVNQENGDSVAVKLKVGPLAYGPNTHWITGFGRDCVDGSRYVYLENGAAYRISTWDSQNLDRWCAGQTIILGCYDGMSLFYGDTILINVEQDQYVHTA